ncbi:TetR/AcrR family transcriptional regulator [Thalassotalea marina]|uniref:TetR family transcriptional regulator n=1 Tax=Thalassotalea marina TaxID=1673741 RepID=A0A919EN01_9GAMM|nr:TetR/AcrR family transcriptional regulator [Thalassotalea marina]GHG05269.1 TetR family transcriptional regulator [Thalassotalea marina]
MLRPSKKEEILQKSLDIFYRNGFHATGVDLIVKETGISKTTIYANFKNKEALIAAVLERRDENFSCWLEQRVNHLAQSEQDKIYCVFDALEEWFNEPAFSSCMFIKASSEFQERDNTFYMQSVQHKLKLKDYFLNLVKLAQLPNPELVANTVVMLKEGAIISAHLSLMPHPAAHAKTMLKELVSNLK